jgi:hypothetical protein
VDGTQARPEGLQNRPSSIKDFTHKKRLLAASLPQRAFSRKPGKTVNQQ